MKKTAKRYDLILIASLLSVSLLSIGALLLFRKNGRSVKVEIDGKISAVYSLSADGEYPLNGGTNILVIEKGEAFIKTSDCPDKTCVRTGRLRHVGESAVCLPNRVSVTVVGEDTGGVDLVS